MRRFLVPETIQTSAMDCGPAALRSLLEGHGIRASYGRLREACQTSVDGTSIDQIEAAAVELGLDASQIMLPADHPMPLPALVVVRQPNGTTHFVVAWRQHGPMLQVMDPAVGRHWITRKRFLEDLYIHTQRVPAEDWEAWGSSDEFQKVLRARMRRLGISDAQAKSPAPPARLDAAVRMTDALVEKGAIRRGTEAARLAGKLAGGEAEIPDEYWFAAPDETDSQMVRIRGPVMVEVQGRRARAESLSPELTAALQEKRSRPGLELLRAIREGGLWKPAIVMGALIVAGAGKVVEALLFRGLFDVARDLTSAGARFGALVALLVFSGALLLLDFSVARAVLRFGRQLEARLRLRFLAKIPRLGDRYFSSRPVSDMAERGHNVQQLRQVGDLGAAFLRASFEMLLTVAGIAWLYPGTFWLALAVAVVSFGVPLLAQPLLMERDLRMRAHAGALMRFQLDALLGLTAIRAHAAELTVRREQLALLGEWARAGLRVQRAVVGVTGLQLMLSLGLSAFLVWTRLAHAINPGGILLLIYWVLNLPALGDEAAGIAWQYPMLRNSALRLIEPLGAPEEGRVAGAGAPVKDAVEIEFDHVTVQAAGQTILEDISVRVAPGEHVGIVGVSGAGKSSLVGLLLGWNRPANGELRVNGASIDVEALRPHTAWVDPQVQLWNQSLFANLQYGADDPESMERILADAELTSVLRRMPDGLQTMLGEGGALVSGGEGQRVRLGRAMARRSTHLVILDEPARGLDRGRRRTFLKRARERWRSATLLCITHDVEDTVGFNRVLVIDNGRIAEDGVPVDLAANPDSLYRRLLDAEHDVRRGLWASSTWRRMWMEDGRLIESSKKEAPVEARA
ncbi:MAG TPA: ATP-binding cassette domain-containing protein [Bryobacteraceae bacterium]|nr:ATP-binding cassette domain-containing protein [Bryobacteraceae bacterium]